MRRLACRWAVVFPLVFAGTAHAQTREAVLVDTATAVFHEIMAIPEQGIPPALLGGAHAIAIVPSVIKAGFLVGARFGRGVLVVRTPDGRWSRPVFLTLGGGSFGLQAGAQATDLVLVFRNQRSLNGFLAGKGKFTLGADASAAAGPVGRQVGAATDVGLSSEILTYSRSRGLFAGLSLEGAALALDWQANVAYYGKVLGPGEILGGAEVAEPPSSARLRAWLEHYGAGGTTAPPTAPTPPPGPPAAPASPVPAGGSVLRSTPASTGPSTASNRRGAWRRSGPAAPVAAGQPAPAAAAPVASTPAPKVLRSTPTGASATTDSEVAPAAGETPNP